MDWQPMDSAPKDREIELRNNWAGRYRGRYEDGQWPLRGPQGAFWEGGVWYPVPNAWREIEDAPGHTDLMVSPEEVDAFLEANPPQFDDGGELVAPTPTPQS